MKKHIVLALMSLFLIVGCTPNNESQTSDNASTQADKTTSVALTKENIYKYFDITKTDGTLGNGMDHYIIFNGVLSFALYDDVNVTLNMHVYAENNPPYVIGKNDDYERVIKLNAAGNGSSTLDHSTGLIDGVVNTGTGGNLYQYSCTWTIKSISGSIKYRI